MLVLQATWSKAGRLLIWGETTSGSPSEEVTGEIALEHPFAATSDELISALTQLEFEVDQTLTLELLLPTQNGRPLSSPKLRNDETESASCPVELAYWSLPAVALTPFESLNMLTSLPSQLPTGIKLDQSLKFWREVSKLLLELLTRGRFLPGIQKTEGTWLSHWYPLLTEDGDRKRAAILAESMPPLCRAAFDSEDKTSSEPSSLIQSFLSIGCDALIRRFLARNGVIDESTMGTAASHPRMTLPAGWLRSLTQPDPVLAGPSYELVKLEQQLRTWSGKLIWTEESPQLKAYFRLFSPKDPTTSNTWSVQFGLRPLTGSEQEITAEDIWRGELGFLKQSSISREELEEMLLKDLGAASHFFPALKGALSSIAPTEVLLSSEDAYLFLKEQAKRLIQEGFVVTLPSWWNRPAPKLGLRFSVNSPDINPGQALQLSFLAAHQLLDYSWELALGDEQLTPEEFKALVSSSSPLVQIRGQWIELNQKKLAATLSFLQGKPGKEKINFIEALRFGLGVEHGSDLLPVTGFSATGWIEKLISSKKSDLPTIIEPETFLGTLRQYQRDGLSWLALLSAIGIGGCLADDMGLGKTIQLLALLAHERQNPVEGKRINPTLLIVPMSILANWEKEASRFTPQLRVYVHHGSDRLGRNEFKERVKNLDLVVTTYSLAHRDIGLIGAVSWGRIALDEAQNIKNLETKQTKAVRFLSRKSVEAKDSPIQRLALTGTPLENHLEELWSIFDFLNPGFLGTVSQFRERFVLPIERFRNREASEILSRLISPFILRRLKSDPTVLTDLPEKIEMDVFTGLTEEQAALYQAVVQDMLPQVDAALGMHRKGLVLATITKLKQICDHPSLLLKEQDRVQGRSGKLERLEEILEEVLAEGDKTLIFTQYAQLGHLLRPYLQDRFDTEVLFLHGGTPRAGRDKMIEKFQKKDGPPLFILSLKAGGFGLNLTEANQVIHFDQWWNPAVQEQATDRAYRIGQKRSVQVRRFICKGTLEEKINEMLLYKRDLADQVVGSTKNMVLQLSTDELRKMLKLTQD